MGGSEANFISIFNAKEKAMGKRQYKKGEQKNWVFPLAAFQPPEWPTWGLTEHPWTLIR